MSFDFEIFPNPWGFIYQAHEPAILTMTADPWLFRPLVLTLHFLYSWLVDRGHYRIPSIRFTKHCYFHLLLHVLLESGGHHRGPIDYLRICFNNDHHREPIDYLRICLKSDHHRRPIDHTGIFESDHHRVPIDYSDDTYFRLAYF